MVIILISCIIFELFDVQNIVTLKSKLGVISLKVTGHLINRIGVSTRNVTMALSCTVFEIKRYINLKTPIFHTPCI